MHRVLEIAQSDNDYYVLVVKCLRKKWINKHTPDSRNIGQLSFISTRFSKFGEWEPS